MFDLPRKREEILSSLAITVAFVAVWGWLAVPELSAYALQAFAGACALFFITKRLQKAQLWHVLPHTHSPEMALVTFALYVLIGSTGNLDSPLLPLSFIHLFIVVFVTGPYSAIVAAAEATLFHWYMATTVSTHEVATLSMIPLSLVFFLFARQQYDAAQAKRLNTGPDTAAEPKS